MASVKVTINGVICDMYGRTITGPVKIVGEAMYSDLGVGGGPMPPQGPVDPGYGISEGHPEHPIYNPPGIWGPTDPRPTPPIYLPPVVPGGPPVGIWPGRPEHPIVLPPEPPDAVPSPPDVAVKPPPDTGGWAYVSTWGWGYFPKSAQPGPKG